MTLKPASINPSIQLNNPETLASLIQQLPIGKVLQAQLLSLEKSSLLIIEQAKPVKVQLPILTLPKNINTVIIQIIEKLPLLKLQLKLIDTPNEVKITPQSAPLSRSITAIDQAPILATHTAKGIVNNTTEVMLLNTKNALEIILKSNTQAEVRLMMPQITNKTAQLPAQAAVTTPNQNQPVAQQALLSKPLNQLLWPQHALLEKLSQTILISKLSQLNTALPTQAKDPFVQVVQKWIKQLISTASENKLPDQKNVSSKAPMDSKVIRRAIANSGHLWESGLKNEVRLQRLQSGKLPPTNLSELNIKAQILRIIQSLPIILSRIDPELAAKFISTETEIWQMVFKIRQHLNLHAQAAMPLPSTQLQPDFWVNWLEQNLKLITTWLRNVEQQQVDLPQQPHQQTLLRFDLPVPNDSAIDWLKVEIEEQNKKASKKKQWKWQLRMSFDFGTDKKLSTITRINEKQLSVLFEGGNYFAAKMTPETLQKFAYTLEEKTGLSSSVEFNNSQSNKSTQINNKLHLEI